MTKITREQQKIFASASNTNEKAAFGSMKSGTPVYSTDLGTLQTSDYEQGWQNALLNGKAPFLEEMNGVQYGLSKQVAYLLQAGISEWLSTDIYYKDDYCRVGHDIFYSNSDDNIGNNPSTDNVNWTHAGNYETATSTTSGLTKLYATTGTNTDGTMTQNAITNALPSQATASSLGTVKLYANTGANTDGAMTQASATSTFQNKLSTMGSVSQPVYVSSEGTLSTCNTIPDTTSSVTSGSTSALTSGGAYTALSGKQNTLSAGTNIAINNNTISVSKTIPDTTSSVTSGSTSALTSGGAYTALNAKQDKLTAGENITISANNVISATGGGTSGAGVAIGTIFSVSCSSTYVPSGALPCDGTQYSKTQFSDFYTNYLVAGLLNTCTFAEYSSDISTYGQCGRFALDTSTGNFRVPNIKDGAYLTQAQSDDELGKSYKESLPNIKGQFCIPGSGIGMDGGTMSTSGAISSLNIFSSSYDGYASHSGRRFEGIAFNASNSSSTYQDDAPVQGDNVRMRYFVQVANGSINQSQMDWSAWATGLQGKANTDLSNCSVLTEISAVVIEDYVNGTSGYRIWSNGYCEQWGQSATISMGKSISCSFLKTFIDTNYNVCCEGILVSTDDVWFKSDLSGFNTTSFTIVNRRYSGSGTDTLYYRWRACGYLAAGEYNA